tara:strand:+ start:398 stop:664 length:267 start_codon:yes stop_codon:yes gene_type:complete
MKKITLSLMDFSERLKAWRADRGLSLEAISKLAGVSKQAVWSWERGRPPGIDKAHKVIIGLGLDMRSFFGPTQAEASDAWESMRNAGE